MNNAEDFILTTDFATLKNDDAGTISVTIPNVTSIPAATVYSWYNEIEVGAVGSSVRAVIYTDKDIRKFYSTTLFHYYTGGTVSGSPTLVGINCFLHRTSKTTLRLTCFLQNPYGSTMTITGLSQTVTANFVTFLPPFA